MATSKKPVRRPAAAQRGASAMERQLRQRLNKELNNFKKLKEQFRISQRDKMRLQREIQKMRNQFDKKIKNAEAKWKTLQKEFAKKDKIIREAVRGAAKHFSKISQPARPAARRPAARRTAARPAARPAARRTAARPAARRAAARPAARPAARRRPAANRRVAAKRRAF